MADRAALHRLLLLLAAIACFALAQMLNGCGGYTQTGPDVEGTRGALVADEIERWEAFFRKPLWRCWEEQPVLQWQDASEDALQRECHVAFEVDGCLVYQVDGPAIVLEQTAVRTVEQTERLERHELTHWLLVCSGYDDTGDPQHRSVVWKAVDG